MHFNIVDTNTTTVRTHALTATTTTLRTHALKVTTRTVRTHASTATTKTARTHASTATTTTVTTHASTATTKTGRTHTSTATTTTVRTHTSTVTTTTVRTHASKATTTTCKHGSDYGCSQDYSGGCVIHCLGGTAAFCGAIFLGPRIGRFHQESKTVIQVRGHSLPFTALGGFILLFGFLAFNGGSQMSISRPGDGTVMGAVVVNTVISGSTSGFLTLIVHRIGILGRTYSLLSTMNGALAGMVAVCSGCNLYKPWAAPIVGVIAGVSFNITSWFMCKIKVDDPVDAVAVHFGGGVWGVLAVAFLRYDFGILIRWDMFSALLLAWQFVGLISIVAWTGALCSLVFGTLKLTGTFRVSAEMEIKGLDIPKHGEPAYPLESYGHGYTENITTVMEDGQLSSTHLVNQNGAVPDGKDVGPYESPEVKVMNDHHHQHQEPQNAETTVILHSTDNDQQKTDGHMNSTNIGDNESTAL
ncbi:hypothetical protein BsWGS_08292 [Bradybaena similaris]